jgi:phage FluMu protein Com
MSGDITDLPVRRCPACDLVFVEDNQMYLEPDRCPRCNTRAESDEKGEEAHE